MFGIQKLTFQYIIFLLNAVAMKTGSIGASINLNIDIKQLEFGKINNVGSAEQGFYASFFQKKQERLMLKNILNFILFLQS